MSRKLAQLNGLAPHRQENHTVFGFSLHGEYLPINHSGVAVGPELTWTTQVTPGDAFDINILAAGVAFWYAPFDVPLAVGGSWDVVMSFVGQNDPVLATPAMRLAYLFR